ncbi:MAG: ATP-dependent DNA helicase RecG, partial [Firmicutes bacterium]|nr:ATP-dependent DNA helicase RecG [Bacillota bacterium]
DERLQLLYAKGTRYYEDEPVFGSSIDDLDMEFITSYCQKIGYARSPKDYIRQNNDFLITRYGREELSGAAVLLFGKHPQRFFQRARIRFIRYEGVIAEVGTRMNVIKDVMFEGKILDMVRDSLEFVRSQIKEYTRLGDDCRFFTTPEYPEFVWKEIIINAIAHRDYSIKGTDIQIKMFDDRITVESPGILPGLVRLNNMRTIHFSRNPKIAAFLHEYDYVQEFGEGVDRMYREMHNAGLPAPEHKAVAFMVHATIRNGNTLNNGDLNDAVNDAVNDTANEAVKFSITEIEQSVLTQIRETPSITRAGIMENLHVSKSTVDRTIRALKDKKLIQRIGSDKTGHWKVL